MSGHWNRRKKAENETNENKYDVQEINGNSEQESDDTKPLVHVRQLASTSTRRKTFTFSF